MRFAGGSHGAAAGLLLCCCNFSSNTDAASDMPCQIHRDHGGDVLEPRLNHMAASTSMSSQVQNVVERARDEGL